MNKIIAAFDSLRFSESTLEYAIYLARESHTELTGIFLDEKTRLGYTIYESLVEQSIPGRTMVEQLEKSDAKTKKDALMAFETRCQEANIQYAIHEHKEKSTAALLHEALFADLLVMDPGETFSYLETEEPAGFVRTILRESKCPVLLVPPVFHPVDKLVFLYDGSPSSVYAIKMFSYLFPEKKELEAKIIHAHETGDVLEIPDIKLVKDWIRIHFPKTMYYALKGKEDDILKSIQTESRGMLIVAGAYHRSKASMWLHPSLADLLMNKIQAPLFIAHT